MAYERGRAEVRSFIAGLPAQIEAKLLRGAARAAAKVVVDEAREQCVDKEVAAALTVKVMVEPDFVLARIFPDPRKPGVSRAIWVEYGTDPHLISVSEEDRGGMSVGRINRLTKEGSLVIGGHFVGPVVEHPGATPHPFLRPAIDTKKGEAIAAAQRYINARVSPTGIAGGPDTEEGA